MHRVGDDVLYETSPSLGKIHTNTLETHHWQINENKLKDDICVSLDRMIYSVKPIIISSFALN